jgi:tRNA threonylcarbamoyladenosine biosynthesis protein TsaB
MMAFHNKESLTDPLILSIETSTNCGSVGLVGPGVCLGEISLTSRTTHSKRLLASIDFLFKETGVILNDIAAIAVGLGPGSFTGLRIALSTAKGLSMASTKPLIGVPTLEGLASQLPQTGFAICPIIDARKKELYQALYRNSSNGNLTEIIPPRAITPENLSENMDEPTLFCGDGINVYGKLISERMGELAHFAAPETVFPRAAAIGKLALSLFDREKFLDPARAVPLYVRTSDAELEFGKKKKERTL